MLSSTLALALLAQSTPVTADNAATVAELTRIADAIDRAVDAKDWPRARAFFADRIRVDFQSLSGQPPAEIASDDLIKGWSANLTAAKTSFHMRTNHMVTIDGDRARMTSAGYAWNRMEGNGEPLWEVWGSYTHDFARTPQGWRVTGMKLEVAHQRGSSWVRDTAPKP
jgi:hypothetical protein